MRILITGSNGLVGQALQSIASEYPTHTFLPCFSQKTDLRNYEATYHFFRDQKPHAIIHLAANVGGLFKNMKYKVEMLEENLLINLNVLKAAHLCQISQVVSCLSTCIFPDNVTYPITEKMLHEGPPHYSNDSYAHAKRMLDIQSRAYQTQYGRKYQCVIPTNVYGPHDHFSLQDGHVIPSLIHRCYLDQQAQRPFMVRGTGQPLRQFIHSHDLAHLIMWTLQHYEETEPLILSVDPEEEVSIGAIAQYIQEAFQHSQLSWDTSFSDGQYRKTASNAKLRTYLPQYKFLPIQTGITQTVEWFKEHYPHVRK